MYYKINEVGELLEAESVSTSDGNNAGYKEFDNAEQALRYFMKDEISVLKDTVDDLVILSLGA